MPPIKIERIVTFTSEDSDYPASNLLSKDPSKKWKCKTAGEKSASVIFQLDQPYQINAVDIGNENSAYIEVLVSRSSTPDDYKFLLVMSSFMSPLEARQSENVNKVRMFKQVDFSEPVRNEKWDRVNVVCTQPFNKHVQYGLSFVNLYCAEGKSIDKPQGTTIGKFLLRPESPDNFSAGSLFARKKMTESSGDQSPSQNLKGAAAIREATSMAHSGSPLTKQRVRLSLPSTPSTPITKKHNADHEEESSNKTPKERKERNRNDLLYSKDEEDKHDKIDKLIEKRAEEKAEAIKRQEAEKEREKKGQSDKRKENSFKQKDKNEDQRKPSHKDKERKNDPPKTPKDSKEVVQKDTPKKRKHKEEPNVEVKKQKKHHIKKPFERLLEGVFLVISGIQNPDRANLRTLALSMGAKYRADWDNTCTHLICAFTNTPKFNQVKGKGKIVTKKWIEDCHSERKRLPWRRYALDKADKGAESEEEIWEEDNKPITLAEPDVEMDIPVIESDDETMQRGSDTEDIVAEIIRKKKQSQEEDIFSVDTDSETTESNTHTNFKIKRKLDNFLKDKIFFVDTKLDDNVARRVKQYIAAYDGILAEKLETNIDIIVTNGSDYKIIQEMYPNARFVVPDWIWECHNLQKLVPFTDFLLQ